MEAARNDEELLESINTTTEKAHEQCHETLTCKFHSGGHFVLAIGMENSYIGPYRCTILDFIIIIICE
jgi:hypothetical protein